MAWRLGIDLGTNSLGWVVVALDDEGNPESVMDLGVRIFPDGLDSKKTATLASHRTQNRGMRRNRDRKIQRQQKLADILVEAKLLPPAKDPDLHKLCPYQLRDKAVSGKDIDSAYHLGRALLHLGKRRGFLSNRKTDGGDDKENTALKQRMGAFAEQLEQDRLFLAQYLNRKKTTYQKGDKPPSYQQYDNVKLAKSVRFKLSEQEFPTRKLYQLEFDKIRDNYRNAFGLNDDIWTRIDDAIFHQRPLKQQERGKCQFLPEHDRANRNLPIAHQVRILQEVNNLKVYINNKMQSLTPEQRDIALALLDKQKEVSFKKLRSQMKLSEKNIFNLESEARQKLNGNEIACDMRKIFVTADLNWDDWDFGKQNDFIERLLEAETDSDIEILLDDYVLPHELYHTLEGFYRKPTYSPISREFMALILPYLQQGALYNEAVLQAGFHHSDIDVQSADMLDYYGKMLQGSTQGAHLGESASHLDNQQAQLEYQYGRIPNPTVHIALNQLRKVTNSLIQKYGKPAEIHIELARDIKNSKKKLGEINKNIATNTKANLERRALIREILNDETYQPTRDDLLKMRLWEELGNETMSRKCIYSGKTISCQMLFTGEVDIEHIIPFSLCFTDHPSNLTLSLRSANQLKGNRTPFEAFGSNQHQGKNYLWSEILNRSKILSTTKQKKFAEDIGDKYRNDKEGNFLERQLVDTQYMARMSRIYLSSLTDGKAYKVVPVNGGVTALLRGKWRLNQLISGGNQKTRNDHAHHAIDALVVALCDRGMIQQIARFSGMAHDDDQKKDIQGRLHVPRPKLLESEAPIKEKLAKMLISYKPDHGLQGNMFNETTYGLKVTDEEKGAGYNGVTRATIQAVLEKRAYYVRDKKWREKIIALLKQSGFDGKQRPSNAQAQDLATEFTQQYHINKLRVAIKNQNMQIIGSAPYKAYAIGEYTFCVIWQIPPHKDKNKITYHTDFVAYREAPHYDYQQNKPHPAAKKIMTLFKQDMILLDYNEDMCQKLERDSHTDAEGRLIVKPYHYRGKDYLLCRVMGYSVSAQKLSICYHRAANPKPSQQAITTLLKLNMRKASLDDAGHLRLSDI
ncbi:MAG: type II CRISPR RNA-guided endonuclease Cas9 [Alphaproteobacteria bacterium]|nr:type II CRISPR RNA-guided endonuclease Cas9 [Alphaproteobacteria bacterium]